MDDDDNFGLAALGTSGDFTVEVLCRSDDEYFLSVESRLWSFGFQLVDRSTVHQLGVFLRTHAGRTAFADLVVGDFGGEMVRIIKDDEFPDRFFLRAAGGGALIDFTFINGSADDFAVAVVEAAAEFLDQM
ncbi:MAG: hypothetical protein JWN70_882 [Planctomycetaceae bacterium]|nr:hypothetical protein [Planctomycetaceae bacterium]